jgi:hypothetical protein
MSREKYRTICFPKVKTFLKALMAYFAGPSNEPNWSCLQHSVGKTEQKSAFHVGTSSLTLVLRLDCPELAGKRRTFDD